MVRRYLRVTGFVQGVGFRWFASRAASRLGITGRVRNREDGSVEIEARGSEAAMEAFLDAVSQGPHYAEVEQVESRPLDLVDERGFEAVDDWY